MSDEPPTTAAVTWLRFMPDDDCAPALWYLDAADLDGSDLGLAHQLRAVIQPGLYAEIEAWIEDWSSWQQRADDDRDPPISWIEEGKSLAQRLRAELEPLGYRIQERLR